MTEQMNDRTVNIPLLRKAVEWAEAEAELGSAGKWYQRDYIQVDAACGTRYCIAGWTLHADGWSDEDIDRTGETAAHAAAVLGVPEFDGNPEKGAHLFSDQNTIEDIRRIAEELAGERL